jgi:hypothetical protein
MAGDGPQRFVLATRASEEFKPPMIRGEELLSTIAARKVKGWAIEFPGLAEPDKETERGEKARIANGKGDNFIWLRQVKIEEDPT